MNIIEMKKDNKLGALTLVCLIASLGMILGGLFAYFSDYIEGNVAVTSGTLDIDGSYTYKHNGVEVSRVDNFNPGDIIVAKASVENKGNKSAWIHGVVDFGTLNSDIANYIKVYDGEKTADQIKAAPTTDILTTANKISLANKIIDGSGANAETESGSVGSSTSQYITIYFDSAAPNISQNKPVNFKYRFEALQYRNNTSAPNWSSVSIEQI